VPAGRIYRVVEGTDAIEAVALASPAAGSATAAR
jgi:hypothetical protein